MPIIDGFANLFRNVPTYLVGRGIITLAVATAGGIAAGIWGVASLPAIMTAAGVAAVGGTLLNAFMSMGRQQQYEQGILDTYRGEIAESLGITPEEVTRADLKEAAQSNEVIDQALRTSRHRTTVSVVTKALAGAVTLGVIAMVMSGTASGLFAELPDAINKTTQLLTTATIAIFSSLIVHDGVSAVALRMPPTGRFTAHDHIMHLNHLLENGRTVTKEQVYAAVVAGNETLAKNITQRFGEGYHTMNPKERRAVLDALGLSDEMERIASAINSREIKPSTLAFTMGNALHLPHAAKAEIAQQVAADIGPSQASFVEKLDLAARENMSHVERLRAQPAAQRTLA